MKKIFIISLILIFCICLSLEVNGGEVVELVKQFPLKEGKLHLSRFIQPQSYFESLGQKSAILGQESGTLEIWIYPYKVLHDFNLYFLLEDDNKLIDGRNENSDYFKKEIIITFE